MPATSALADVQALVTAVESAGGRTPEPLMNILWPGQPYWPATAPLRTQRRASWTRPVAGTLTEERLADLLTEAAQRQLVASFRGELRQRAERISRTRSTPRWPTAPQTRS